MFLGQMWKRVAGAAHCVHRHQGGHNFTTYQGAESRPGNWEHIVDCWHCFVALCKLTLFH